MQLREWRFRVLNAYGIERHTVTMHASKVRSSGLRFEVAPHDTGRASFEARPDGPRLNWGDVLEIEASADGVTFDRVYRGEARQVGFIPPSGPLPAHLQVGRQYQCVSLSQRVRETELPEFSSESIDAGAQVRAVIQAVLLTDAWGAAITYDAAKIPDIGVNAPKLKATSFALLGEYLDELTGYVNSARGAEVRPVVWGVDRSGDLCWGVADGGVLDLTTRTDIRAQDWGEIVCENPVTSVRWFLKPFQNVGAYTTSTQHPSVATLGRRSARQSLNALDVWGHVNDPSSPGLTEAQADGLGKGTYTHTLTYTPGGALPTFDLRPALPWVYWRVKGKVNGGGVQFALSYDGDKGELVTQVMYAADAQEFDFTVPGRTDLKLTRTGVHLTPIYVTPSGSSTPVALTITQMGYFTPDTTKLGYLAGAFYRLPQTLVGQVELTTLQLNPTGYAQVIGPDGTLQTAQVTTEYLITREQYGHTVIKFGDPDPAVIRATQQLMEMRLQDASGRALGRPE